MRFNNPIIPGFNPDPSICRVGHDYYLVTSSFTYFPGVPIYHSQDLVSWRHIGYCLDRASQLDLMDTHYAGGVFAPTLRYPYGRFYMITTVVLRSEKKHFYVFSEQPKGPWSEPVSIDESGVSPDSEFGRGHDPAQQVADPVVDTFDSDRLALPWNFRRAPAAGSWTLGERFGSLGLRGTADRLDDTELIAFLGQRQEHHDARVQVPLDFESRRDREEAGLAVYYSESCYYALAVTRRGGSRLVSVRKRIGDVSVVAAEELGPEGPLTLWSESGRHQYTFGWSTDGMPGRSLATGLSRFLEYEVSGGFTGVYFGLYATGNGQPSSATAWFDDFIYGPK